MQDTSICRKGFGLMELVDLSWLRNCSNKGMSLLEIEYDNNVWTKINV